MKNVMWSRQIVDHLGLGYAPMFLPSKAEFHFMECFEEGKPDLACISTTGCVGQCDTMKTQKTN